MRLPTHLGRFLWYFLRKWKIWVIFIQITALAWAIDNTVWPYAFKLLIDKILGYHGDLSQVWGYLAPVLIFWLCLWVSIEILFRSCGFLIAYVFPRVEATIRMSMFEYVTQHSFDFFANHFAGNISNKISDMTQSASHVITQIITLFVPVGVALIIATCIFASMNKYFALLIAGYSLFNIGVCLITAKRCASLSHTHAEARSTLTGKIVDSFTNIITVKVFSRQNHEYAYVGRHQKEERSKHQASQFYVEKVKILLGLSSLLFPGLGMTWLALYNWQQGLITVGDLVLILNTTSNISILTWMVSLELPSFFKEIGICQQALSIIRAKHDVVDKKGAYPLKVHSGSIQFENVNFYYRYKTPILKNFSVTIDPGTKVGLVGFSGSGKSTFVNLIMRFFDIQSGVIRIDGEDISQVTIHSLRSQISMIPQDPSLFHRSIRDNISYGKLNASDEEVINAAKKAHCHEFIQQIPGTYETLVGERGIKLSGGQRQRIAIARAILEDQPILILDEATSALDSVTEKYIQDALHNLMHGRTTIVIAHRLSTLSQMDRLLVFDNGQIIEDGTHAELLKTHGHYAKMWHMQAGGFLPDGPDEL